MKHCPHCKSDTGIEWRDYGKVHVYFSPFGTGCEGRECVNVIPAQPEKSE